MRNIRENILELLFPKICLICGGFDAWLCAACCAKVNIKKDQRCGVCERLAISGVTHPICSSRATLDGLLAAGNFQQLQPLLHTYKYQLVKELAGPLADVFVRFIRLSGFERMLRHAVLVPVPLHRRRLRYRGFNQSELLAERLASKLQLTLAASLLSRKRWTAPQVTLDKPQRRENMRDTFAVNQQADAAGRNIVLIDDIATTGATLNACAKVLKRAGAQTVWGLVLAHG